MKKIFSLFVLVGFFSITSYSQFIHKIKADSVLITNDSCNAELNLENSTKDTIGFLYNKGKGRTQFRKGLIKIDDTLYIIGNDTLNIAKGISGNYIRNQNIAAQPANFWVKGNNIRIDKELRIAGDNLTGSDEYLRLSSTDLNFIRRKAGETAIDYKAQNQHRFYNDNAGADNYVFGTSQAGSVLINTQADVPASILTVGSTSKGWLKPRMTTTQRDAIASPVAGLEVYNTTTKTTDYYDGTAWLNNVTNQNAASQTGNFWISGEGILTGLRAPKVAAGVSNSGGSILKIAGAVSTGIANGANIEFHTTPAGTSGTTQNTEALRMTIAGHGGVGIATEASTIYKLAVANGFNLKSGKYLIDLNTNEPAIYNLTNASHIINWSNSSFSGSIATFRRNGSTAGEFNISSVSNFTNISEVGTLEGYAIGIGHFNSSFSWGTIAGATAYGTLVFDRMPIATNPNAISVLVTDGTTQRASLIIKKNSTVSIPHAGIMAHSVTGTDIAGTRLKLSGGLSTGTGVGGSIEFYTTGAGATGTTINTETLRMTLSSLGNLGIGTSTPTAKLHITEGSASANTAPIKLTAGTNMTTPENGAVEYDGANYFATANTVRYTIAKTLTTTSALNFPATAAGTSSDLTITLTGATDGDAVSLGVPNAAMSTNGLFAAWVSAANTVTVRFSNNDLSNAIDPASGTFRISILKY